MKIKTIIAIFAISFIGSMINSILGGTPGYYLLGFAAGTVAQVVANVME
jgi:hypothetical protein